MDQDEWILSIFCVACDNLNLINPHKKLYMFILNFLCVVAQAVELTAEC